MPPPTPMSLFSSRPVTANYSSDLDKSLKVFNPSSKWSENYDLEQLKAGRSQYLRKIKDRMYKCTFYCKNLIDLGGFSIISKFVWEKCNVNDDSFGQIISNFIEIMEIFNVNKALSVDPGLDVVIIKLLFKILKRIRLSLESWKSSSELIFLLLQCSTLLVKKFPIFFVNTHESPLSHCLSDICGQIVLEFESFGNVSSKTVFSKFSNLCQIFARICNFSINLGTLFPQILTYYFYDAKTFDLIFKIFKIFGSQLLIPVFKSHFNSISASFSNYCLFLIESTSNGLQLLKSIEVFKFLHHAFIELKHESTPTLLKLIIMEQKSVGFDDVSVFQNLFYCTKSILIYFSSSSIKVGERKLLLFQLLKFIRLGAKFSNFFASIIDIDDLFSIFFMLVSNISDLKVFLEFCKVVLLVFVSVSFESSQNFLNLFKYLLEFLLSNTEHYICRLYLFKFLENSNKIGPMGHGILQLLTSEFDSYLIVSKTNTDKFIDQLEAILVELKLVTD
ncbi:hypothetical protein GEMRC1_013944 [Eukaryota sp. GEM-RC1]